MFIAGLTAREIADLCKKNIATVHLHLKKREKYEPGFYIKHVEALEARGPHRVTTQWRRRMREAHEFYSTHGRLPLRAGDFSERSLATWIAEQRRLYDRNELPQAKISLLGALPGWNVNERTQENEMRWRKKLALFIAFVATEHRMPRYRTYATQEEHVLGVWLHNQHQRRAQNRLELWKLEALNKAVPGWRSRS
ncbi:helicase associated domain-containing protein [Glutamicibacter nicotianae]|uniref:helicase associated domain-containing protein n=1 Tax=Glutamicibacter nicotianae TaxID=37929 RepID=UPI001CBCC775|nr:helicase associated domain-containing protein [Glutamicibacter nicotianae]